MVRWITFKISARQAIEEHLTLRVEQVTLALVKMVKERVIELQQIIVSAVESVLFGEGEVATEQVAIRTVNKPMAMQSPFATKIDQALNAQCLQHQIPG